MLRHHHANPARPPWLHILRSWLGAVTGMAVIAWLSQVFMPDAGYVLLLGSFGATAVLLFGICTSPFAQPRNLFGGHLLSALIGVASVQLFPENPVVAAPLAVATAVAVMQLSRTLHPPGGATALIAVIGPESVQQLGFAYLLPVLIGITILFVAAVVSLNLFARERRYPLY